MAQQIFLGDEDFIERMQAMMDPGRSQAKAIPRHQRRISPKPILYFLERSKSRDEGIVAAAGGQHGLSDIANATGLSISRVSRIVRQAESVTR